MTRHMAKNVLDRKPPLATGNGSEEGRRLGYYLRDKPKNSWKFSELMEDAQENLCPVCNKRFRSTRALFGHRKIHSREDDESSDKCGDHSKGSSSVKSCRDQARPIHYREGLNLSLSSEDPYVGWSKTKGDLLLSVLFDDEAMHTTRRKRTPRIMYDFDERTEGVLCSVPNEFSFSGEAEQDLGKKAATLLIMLSRCGADCNSSDLPVKPFLKSSALDFFEIEKPRITASEYNQSHSTCHLRTERKGVELEVPVGILCGAWEDGHKKLKAARPSEEPMCEGVMMDGDAMGIAGSDSRERAEPWIRPGLNSNGEKVCVRESQVRGESGEEDECESREAESYIQDAPVDASQGIEGNHCHAELESVKDYSKKANRHMSLICHKDFSSGEDLGSLKLAYYAKNTEANAEMLTSMATHQRLADIRNMVEL